MARQKDKTEHKMNILVTVTEQHRDRLDAIADLLKSAGMTVAEKFPLGGVIAGEVATRNMRRLHTVDEGIAAVEEEPTFHAQG